MELVDVKLPKKSKTELKAECEPISTADQDRWPWGLQLLFEKEEIAKIPSLTNYKVGDKVAIQAEASVTSIRMSERQNGKEDHTVELQIEKVSCEPVIKKSLEKMSPSEYRKAREGK
jgi:ribosomal protein L21E